MRQKLHPCIGLLAIFTCFASLQAQDDISYDDLRKKLSFDTTPLKQSGEIIMTYADMLERVTPAVVTISAKREPDEQMKQMMDDPLFRRMFPFQIPNDQVTGSGVIISEDGFILTNNHVIDRAENIQVRIDSRREDYDATLVATDPKSDVALLKIKGDNLPRVTIGDSSSIRVGDVTFAVGNPFGLSQTVTQGIISALGRSTSDVPIVDYANFIQTDASINKGNSGGALIDARGRLIGINTAIQSGGMGGNVGIGFAIPANMALDIVDRLLSGGGVVKRGFLGVRLQPMERNLADALGWEKNYGVVVADVVDGTPAAKAGFQPGDLIVSYEGEEAASPDRLRLRISNTLPNQEVKFGIFRNGKEKELTLKLAELPDDLASLQPQPQQKPKGTFLEGVEISELTPESRERYNVQDDVNGVIVAEVDPDSNAADAGLRVGHVILEVNQEKVTSLAEAMKARAKFDGEVLLLRVSAGGARSMLAVRVKD